MSLEERYGAKKRRKASKASSLVVDADLGWEAVQAPQGADDATEAMVETILGDAPVLVEGKQEEERGTKLGVWTEAAEDAAPGGVKAASDSDSEGPRRRRYDSDAPSPSSSEESDSDAEVERRPSDAASASAAKPEAGSDDASDSDDSDAAPRRRPPKMSSGHAAGLHGAATFAAAETELQGERKAKLATLAESSGQGAETVYRDKRGRKLDMLTEFMRQTDVREAQEVKDEREQQEWGRGTAQKAEDAAYQQELENIRAEPFARARDDARLEAMRKGELRADDPMLAYVQKKRAARGGEGRPVYAGPPAPPNRFGLKPGYRWDGVDRGNGFEARLLERGTKEKLRKERDYKYRAADM